ncbi:hypothetical protein [Streptomyces sp. ST2-7A]|uniref:hypothetical protein n=1 Tax=Streptomyces sp. ST2-7A TaxID=2907214 RepID=UPI001F3B8B3C|nr:hypothetical protein [Streptomyces sp. ST2-7A]
MTAGRPRLPSRPPRTPPPTQPRESRSPHIMADKKPPHEKHMLRLPASFGKQTDQQTTSHPSIYDARDGWWKTDQQRQEDQRRR